LSVDPTFRPAFDAAPPPGRNVVHDVILTYVDPVRVFFNLPRVNRSTTALVILLVLQGLVGWAIVKTGVYEYEVRRQAERMAFAHIKAHEADDDPNIARDAADGMIKASQFQVILYQAIKTIGRPLGTLAGVGLIAGFLFVAVALSGGKPKMALLTGIVAFASFVQLPQDAVTLYLTGKTKHSRVETSAAAFPSSLGGEHGVSIYQYIALRRLNPFDLWFWWLVHLGARRGARMTGRGATISVLAMMLVAMLAQSGMDYAELANQPPPMQQQ
jgi:hypothetical protein